ncbi:AP-3 complex subunit mu-2-like [Amblyomma americanum]
MIHSVFFINGSGDVFTEKHWKSVIRCSVCDFFDVQKKAASPVYIPPVISAPHHYLINIYCNKMFFVAVTVYEGFYRIDWSQLLDEMLDSGFPLATESNILKELIKPPNILRTLANTVTGRTNLSSQHPAGQLSNVPWRRTGVKYANNEAYFDVVEEVDAIINKSGLVISAEIQGYVDYCIKLSGMPDLSLTFVNPCLFGNVSFHPCVRFRHWEMSSRSERVLSFVPPDGNFRLVSYHIESQSIVFVLIFCRHNISRRRGACGPPLRQGIWAHEDKVVSEHIMDVSDVVEVSGELTHELQTEDEPKASAPNNGKGPPASTDKQESPSPDPKPPDPCLPGSATW